ncbi:hypothetical protein K1T73_16265 [Roseovarius sp. SCSIO 43702]|uniref:hypothetical protein n=1 Tax=Roseovarius sp. SCSIO 43702 TaxID=2823043 RepID=UPI001C72AE09|nr:hypothetical protein [Roseovarius sp. SCSIO 43702]QYX56575.1 hypothetical protein K1T73_16265 [Roseovarius sp. SCSIO 43702]
MFARVTRYKLKPGAREAAIAQMETMKSDIMGLPGMQHFINVANEDGNGYVVAIVESRQISDSNADKVAALWGRMSEHLAEKPTAEGYDVGANWSN